MKISAERHTKLYAGISDPIMDLRVDIRMNELSKEQLDAKLFTLQNEIHRRIKVALDLRED